MERKHFVLIIPLTILIVVSCANRKALVENQVVTKYIKGGKEEVWYAKEASRSISLKSLKVLIIDDTEIDNVTGFKENPIVISDDAETTNTIVESRFYNKLVLESMGEALPQRAKAKIITQKLTDEELNLIVNKDNYDLIIKAKKISFNYHFHSIGYDSLMRYEQSISNFRSLGNTGYSTSVGNYEGGGVTTTSIGGAYAFHSRSKLPPLLTRTVTYKTQWVLEWRNIYRPKQIVIQEGTRVYYNRDCQIIKHFAIISGKNVAQVFKW